MSFHFSLVFVDGRPAEPGRFVTAVPGWRPGDPIFIRPGLAYRVVEAREGVLVVTYSA